MVVFIGDDNVQRLSSTATTPSAVMSLVSDAPKSIKTMTIYSKYFTVCFDSIPGFILLHEKLLQFDWLRAVVFQLNLKYLHVKITNLLRVLV